jgi:serine O-acetyltransferase
MFELFIQDARRWVVQGQINHSANITLRTLLVLLYRYMPLRAMAWFRFVCWCKHKSIPFFPGFTQRLIYRRYGLEIVVGADIAGGLYIAHPIGTVIAVKRMGQNCSVIAAVTIGMRNEWEFPDIGDAVFIGAGARVLGGITIGNNAVIGANAVVITDIPAGTTAVGIPAKVIRTKTNGVHIKA